MWVDYGSQATTTNIVVKRFRRCPFRLVAELGVHPRGVHDSAIT
jgi:hypothetical protein